MPKTPAIPTIHTFSSHATRVEIGDERFYYSYDTLIAYETRQLRIRLVSPSRSTTLDLKKMNVSGKLGVERFEVVTESMFLDLINL